jgi:hypothetical protein
MRGKRLKERIFSLLIWMEKRIEDLIGMLSNTR